MESFAIQRILDKDYYAEISFFLRLRGGHPSANALSKLTKNAIKSKQYHIDTYTVLETFYEPYICSIRAPNVPEDWNIQSRKCIWYPLLAMAIGEMYPELKNPSLLIKIENEQRCSRDDPRQIEHYSSTYVKYKTALRSMMLHNTILRLKQNNLFSREVFNAICEHKKELCRLIIILDHNGILTEENLQDIITNKSFRDVLLKHVPVVENEHLVCHIEIAGSDEGIDKLLTQERFNAIKLKNKTKLREQIEDLEYILEKKLNINTQAITLSIRVKNLQSAVQPLLELIRGVQNPQLKSNFFNEYTITLILMHKEAKDLCNILSTNHKIMSCLNTDISKEIVFCSQHTISKALEPFELPDQDLYQPYLTNIKYLTLIYNFKESTPVDILKMLCALSHARLLDMVLPDLSIAAEQPKNTILPQLISSAVEFNLLHSTNDFFVLQRLRPDTQSDILTVLTAETSSNDLYRAEFNSPTYSLRPESRIMIATLLDIADQLTDIGKMALQEALLTFAMLSLNHAITEYIIENSDINISEYLLHLEQQGRLYIFEKTHKTIHKTVAAAAQTYSKRPKTIIPKAQQTLFPIKAIDEKVTSKYFTQAPT